MASDAAPQVKTVVINWVETSYHRISGVESTMARLDSPPS
ncbi:Uncharacterised protein [Mycolicibacterium phlei]|jgi:hypothetical protein|nr:hypothetical protein MPHLCCUG_03533 [Mycolicibacterium phlei]STZ20531.1 Uncharacterised protein [Mycolicibacterium phlei]VEG10436.1 Uncharacterised protein [Mycobacteroides chelonae]